jgi:chromosome segregation ATPase
LKINALVAREIGISSIPCGTQFAILLKTGGQGDMMADSRYDELERRVRTVEEEATGEKHLTRYAVEQTVRNGEVLHALRSEVAALRIDISAVTMRVDHLGVDMAAVKAALVMHGRALDVLQQDVRQLRGEVATVRDGMATVRDEVSTVRDEVATVRDEVATIRNEVATIRNEVATVRDEVATIRSEIATMRQEAVEQHNALLAAIQAMAGPAAPPA